MIDFCGISLAHRVLNASGTFDAIAARRAFGDALLERFPFAAFVSKTVTVEPRQGNPPPRLFEQAGGMINSIGLPNKGLEGYLRDDLPQLAELPVPLIVNVMGFSREEVATLVAAFAEREEVAALELNVSCPNVKTGMVMGADPAETAALLDAVRPLTDKPVIVKLTPNCTSPADVAQAARDHGADAVSLVNTLRGMAFDPGKPGAPMARRRHRRRVRPGDPAHGPLAGRRGPRAGRDPDRRDGRGPDRESCFGPPSCGRRSGRRGDRVVPRSTRGRQCGIRTVRAGTEVPRKQRGKPGRTRCTRPRHSTIGAEKSCKRALLPSSALQTPKPQLEVQLNSGATPCPSRSEM